MLATLNISPFPYFAYNWCDYSCSCHLFFRPVSCTNTCFGIPFISGTADSFSMASNSFHDFVRPFSFSLNDMIRHFTYLKKLFTAESQSAAVLNFFLSELCLPFCNVLIIGSFTPGSNKSLNNGLQVFLVLFLIDPLPDLIPEEIRDGIFPFGAFL